MKISVIVPTYKPQYYLWECLDSLCNQDFPKYEYEIIVVLNGCFDPYDEQIRSYIKKKTEVQFSYIQTDTPGVSNARNLAIDKAKGQYIAFVDDDDLVSASYLSELFEKAGESTVSLAYPYAFNDGNNDIQLDYSITHEYDRYVEKGCQHAAGPKKFFSGPCMKLIHREIISARRFDPRFKNGEDSLFMFLLSDRIKKVDFTSKQAIYFRRFRTDSATTRAISIKEVALNCWHMFSAYSSIYFSNLASYSFKRYVMVLLGLGHVFVQRVLGK